MVRTPHEDEYLSALLQISSSLNSSLDFEEVLGMAIDQVVNLLDAERGFIMLRENGALITKAMKNFPHETIEKGREISHTVIEEVMSSGDPVLTVNAMDDKRFSAKESVSLYRLRSVLCVPLVRQDANIGVIYLDNRWKSGIFSRRDLETLITFANHASIAIDNARLYKNLKESMEEKLRLQEEIYRERTRTEVEKETGKLREELVHYIVHDLRNPLTVVMTAFSIADSVLSDPEMPENSRKLMERGKDSLDTVAAMLNDILDVYRLENRQLTLNSTVFDLKLTAEQVLKTQGVLRPVNVRFESDFPVEGLRITADENLMSRVLTNLVQNACKWTETGYIRIIGRMENDPDRCVIEVADTGPGIPEEYRRRIFSKFVKVERKGEPGVSKGLGLAFCKYAVKAHGGHIGARANPEGGTMIVMVLPVQSELPGTADTPPSDQA